MARAAELLVFFGVLMLAVYFAVCAYNQAVKRRRPPPEPWALTEHAEGDRMIVYCEHPGDQPLVVGAVPWADPDFESKIEVVRSEGRLKLAALNSDAWMSMKRRGER